MGVKKICLVTMPFCTAKAPVMGLSLLKAAAKKRGIDARVVYANLRFARLIGAEAYFRLDEIAAMYMQLIEAVFSPYAGYGHVPSRQETMEYFRGAGYERITAEFFSLVQKCDSLIPGFLDALSDEILAEKPDVVGCTYTFAQCNADLALLKRIREKAPGTVTVIGGSSVGPERGQALVDRMGQVDYAFVGESDDNFCDALDLIAEGRTEELYARFPEVLHRGGIPAVHAVRDLNAVPYPDFDDYFAELFASGLAERVSVDLPVEASRGCWWGEKHRCCFCGLHPDPELLCYRRKESRRFADELAYLAERYQVRSFFLTDCILAREHVRELPELLAGKGYSLFSEVKTNMTREDVQRLRRAGFTSFQPGIESLNDHLLRLMHKGNRGIKHVEFLKNAKEAGIYLAWNLLYSFPGEKAEWYYHDMEFYPLLFHLPAPQLNPHGYQRQSIFTQRAADYGVTLKPDGYYPYLFGEELAGDSRFHEFFLADPPQSTPYFDELLKLVLEWKRASRKGCTLSYRLQYGLLAIYDGRPCALQETYVLDGLEKDVCLAADQAVRIDRLLETCGKQERGRAEEVLEELIRKKLILRIGDEVLFLAVPEKRKVL